MAVEYDGYLTPEATAAGNGNDEADASNNVAVTDVGVRFRWDALAGEFTLTPETAFEGDQSGQHTGDLTARGGATLTIAPQDASEVLTRLTLDYDASHGDLVLTVGGTSLTLASGAELSFAFDPAEPTRIVSLTTGGETHTVPGLTLRELTSGGLRYVPHEGDNDDADVPVRIEADTRETTTGVTGSLSLSAVVVVDAVADRPVETASALIVTNGKNGTVIVNEAKNMDSVDVTLQASFSDYADGSERHYFFVANQYLASLEGLPTGIRQLDATEAADIAANAGLEDGYFVLEVSDAYLAASAGAVDITLTAHLDGAKLPDEERPLHLDIKAGAIEHQGVNTPTGDDLGGGHGQDASAANNVSLVDMGLDIRYARLDNAFAVTVTGAHEGDAPNQHVGNLLPAGGATVDFAPTDTSEVFDTLSVAYADGDGSLYLDLSTREQGNVRVELPDGAQLAFTYRNEGAGATICAAVSITTPEGDVTHTLVPQLSLRDLLGGGRLHYIPDSGSQNDADVSITFSGMSRETATGEKGAFSHEVTVVVDAVADRPEALGEAGNAATGHTALEPGVPFPISLSVNFGADTADGSERHYLFISRDYLDALTVPTELAGSLTLLNADQANEVCAHIDGPGGLPGATADTYFVLEADNAWLRASNGAVDVSLLGTLKSAAGLAALGASEGDALTLAMKAVSVEHDGFQTVTGTDLGGGHGQDSDAANNVAVVDASARFGYALADGDILAKADPAFEGDQPRQHTGDRSTEGGAAITLAPEDASEVFRSLTFTYDGSHGSLTLTAPDGTSVRLEDGATLSFTYDAVELTRCVAVAVRQPGDTAPSATLSFTDAAGFGMYLPELTASSLKYVPTAGDDSDADVTVSYAGVVRETESGAETRVNGSLDVVVDAVADMPREASGSAASASAARPGVMPGEPVAIHLEATFDDYADGSEAHYVFLAREHLPALNGVPLGVDEVTDPVDLAAIFSALARTDGTGIHAGSGAAADYHVLRVSDAYLAAHNGAFSMDMTVTAGAKGVYPVDAAAVSVEYGGYRTDTANADGSGANADVTAENNVAVAGMGFDIVVREFEPGYVSAALASEWVYENDRSRGNEAYHAPDDNGDRDHGTGILFSGQGEGNVIAAVTFEYAMPSNGSATPHRIESLREDGTPNPGVSIVYNTTSRPGFVTVTVTAADPYAGVGDLFFVPGDNYDNEDVDITVTHVDVADPWLRQTTLDDPDWGHGVEPGGAALHVRVDAVAQAPEVGNFAVDHDSGNPVKAGDVLHITGEISFEDTADGSEEHFILLEIQDGYYPDAVTLEYDGRTVSIPITHYSSEPARAANYTLQQLVTADDGQPHLFIKLPVDGALAGLAGAVLPERMDGIALKAAYQTREWSAEGASLHFAAIAAEDVENVREYDANWNIVNDELPFDRQLEQHVPGLKVTANNTAVTVAAQGAYVYWDETDSDALNFRGYVFENDRPADNQRDPAYWLRREAPLRDTVYSYPSAPELTPADAATGRDYGTGMELEIPEHTRQISITELAGNQGNGDFYFLPETVWQAYRNQSPAPAADTALASYRVEPDGTAATAPADAAYTLVFIPSHEPYNDAHGETNASHKDNDFRFSYELMADQYGPDGTLRGQKKFLGDDLVIRVDAVANQAEIVSAATAGTEPFSLWNVPDSTSSFELTVDFHDLDATEDHYILVEMPPNFAFRCGDYLYQPGAAGSVSPQDQSAFYTHVMTSASGEQTFIRYYKIPVNMADIDPVTGRCTVQVEFLRQPGMPAVADYPSSQNLTYGALTEDKTASRWDSWDPTAENFVNRKGADGEYTYDNNTSVILRNGIGNGADDDHYNPGWLPGGSISGGGSGGSGGGSGSDGSGGGGGGGGGSGSGSGGGGGGGGHSTITWGGGPGGGWSGGVWPGHGGGGGGWGSGGRLDDFWNPSGPGGGGSWWKDKTSGGGSGGGGSTSIDDWVPGGGGGWSGLPDDPDSPYGPSGPSEDENRWIASRGEGLALEWAFENSTPLGYTEAGQYNAVMPTRIYLTGERPGAATLKIFIPNGDAEQLIDYQGNPLPWILRDVPEYTRATLALKGNPPVPPLSYTDVGTGWEYTIPVQNGHLQADQQLFMMLAPDSMGEDFQIGVSWYDANGTQLSTGKVDVLVDAVAQWANFSFEKGHEDGVYGVTGDEPSTLVRTELDVAFLDQDGSESNFLLVEKIPGVLPLHANGNGGYDAPEEVYLEGRTYYLITPSQTELETNKVALEVSVNEDLLSPMYVEKDIEHQGQTFTGVRLRVGTLTMEGQTGVPAMGGEPANWEYTLDNNTALNLREDALTIVVSRANGEGGNSAIMTKETATPDDNLLWLDPEDPARALNLTMDGNDALASLIFTEASGNGEFFYRDGAGVLHPLPLHVDMAQAYREGRIGHRQNRYDDTDARLTWSATVKDGLTDDTDVVAGTLTVAVDAVASAEEIHLGYPALDRDAGTLTQTLTFDDHEGNEQHFAVIAPDLYRVVDRQAQVRDGSGQWHAVDVETIFDPSGNPYYAVRLDGLLDSTGAATVRFGLHELNVPGIARFPVISGGVSVEPNTGYSATDREMDLKDNWAINTKAEFVSQGVVDTDSLAFVIDDPVTEDDPAGAAIALSGDLAENDALMSATLTLAPQAGAAPFAGAAGEQIATVIYDGQCFAVTLDAAGAASADVSFGAGFDPAADFRLIWGVAHMEQGQPVVTAWNHAVDGPLDLRAACLVRNQLSGQTASVTGADADGVTLVARADAADGVSGVMSAVNGQPAQPGASVGAAADTVTVTLSAAFADVDGSESHALLLEVPTGWQVTTPADGTFETREGVRYYRVTVESTRTDPSVDVTLVAPDTLNQSVTLRTGAVAVEANGDEAFTQGAAVALPVSDVSASGVSAPLAPVLEDGLLSLEALGRAALVGNDGNDVLQSVTFTDLAGGSLVMADGSPAGTMTLTAAQLASGGYFYRPAANYAGETDAQGRPLPVTLTYDALLGESDTGATALLTGQTLAVTVTPVADAPEQVGGSAAAGLGAVQTGHKALVAVTLDATFPDADGSEEHFFVLAAPKGVAVASGDGYGVNLLTAAEAAALNLPDAFPADAPLYKVTLTAADRASVALSVNLEVTTTLYNGGDLHVLGASSELRQDGSRDYARSDAHNLPLPPAIGHDIGNNAPAPVESAATLDSLRAASVTGTLDMDVDPDGDAVVPGGLAFGATTGVRTTVDGRDCYSVQGDYGTLHLFDGGEWRYDRDPAHQGAAGQEVFTYTLKDAYGGEGQGAITVTLTNANTAPVAEAFTARLDSARQSATTDMLVFQDAEGDAVSVAGVNGSTARVNLGTADAPRWGFRVAGDYGTLDVWEADGQWRYSYTLDAAHRGETEDERFTLTLRDAYGMEAQASLAIDLFNANVSPVAGNAAAGLDTLRDPGRETGGNLAVSDADGDTVSLKAASGYGGAAGVWATDGNGQPALVATGQHGTLYLYDDGAGSLRYRYVLTDTAAGGVDATETFTYTVDDGYLGTASASIVITLDKTNNAPEITGNLTPALDTLRDADGVTEGALTFSDPDYSAAAGRHDRVTLSGVAYGAVAGVADGQGGFTVDGTWGVFHMAASGDYTYTLRPEHAGVTGSEAFVVTVTDEFGASSTKTVNVDLLVRNVNPTASSGHVDLNTWRGGGQASGAVQLADADGDTVTVSAVTGLAEGVWGTAPDGTPAFVAKGTWGQLYLRQNGSFDYVLHASAQGASGTEHFAFTVQDGFGGTASGSIDINLDDANAAPVISGDISAAIGGDIEQYRDGIVRESGQMTWSDADGDDIAFIIVGGETLPASGTVTVEGRYGSLALTTDGGNTASWVYTLHPGLDADGIVDTDNFSVVVRDIYGGESVQPLSINLAPLSHVPECDDINLNWAVTPSGAPVSYMEGTLSFRDTDMNYDPEETLILSVNGTAVTEEAILTGRYGQLTISPDGSFTYTTTHIGEALLEDFTYTATDKAGNVAEAHLYIRLGDGAPAFPNTGGTGEGIFSAVDGTLATFMDAAVPGTEATPTLPEPVEVALANVPLPYDVDATQHI